MIGAINWMLEINFASSLIQSRQSKNPKWECERT